MTSEEARKRLDEILERMEADANEINDAIPCDADGTTPMDADAISHRLHYAASNASTCDNGSRHYLSPTT